MKQVGVRFRLGIGGPNLGLKSELQNLQREVDRDCSVNEYTSDIVWAWVPQWIDEWIVAFLPNHLSLRKDSQ